MPSFAVDDVLQVTYNWTVFAQRLMTVLHYRFETVPAGSPEKVAVLAALASKFSEGTMPMTAAFLQATPNNITLLDVQVQQVKPVRTIYQRGVNSNAGTFASAAQTANLCASIEKQSIKVGRDGVGRIQWPPLTPDTLLNGFVDSDYRDTQLETLSAELASAQVLIAPFGYPCTLRPCLPAGGADHDYDLWDCFPEATARTMHRRTVGLGI